LTECFLAQIQIEATHAMSHPGQSGGQMHGCGRLARPAFFIAHDDNMRHFMPLKFSLFCLGYKHLMQARKAACEGACPLGFSLVDGACPTKKTGSKKPAF
jgi:hypothetical protein